MCMIEKQYNEMTNLERETIDSEYRAFLDFYGTNTEYYDDSTAFDEYMYYISIGKIVI